MTTKTHIINAVFTKTLLYQSDNWTLTSKERQMLTTTEMRCLRKAAGKTRMDKIRNEEIRRRVNMQPAQQTSNKTRSGGGHTSKGWHQRLPRAKHSWSSQKDDDRGEGHEIAGKMMYRDGTMRWESRWQTWTTGSRRDVRLYIHSTPMAEEFD